MNCAVKEIEPDVWRVEIAGTIRIVRYRRDIRSFAPWDICSAEGRRLWGAPTLESAFRWIQARTGYPAEALLVEGLLEQTASNKAFDTTRAEEDLAAEPQQETAGPGV